MRKAIETIDHQLQKINLNTIKGLNISLETEKEKFDKLRKYNQRNNPE